jgi:hypothetical protein
MNATRKFQFSLMALLLVCNVTMAQSLSRQTICSTGGSNTVSGVLVSQTIGQPYHTNANYNNGISYRPGFQQPTAGHETNSVGTLNISLFPNPVFDLLNIESSDVIPNAVISVVDVRGETIYFNRVSNLKTFRIDCQQWPNGTYVFSVSNEKSSTYSSNIIVIHY